MWNKRPSQNSQKLVEKLRKAFKDQGHGDLSISADGLMFVSGGWKKLDVYRWELWGDLTRPDKSYIDRISIGCWETARDCVRYPLDISKDSLSHYEVTAILPKQLKPSSPDL